MCRSIVRTVVLTLVTAAFLTAGCRAAGPSPSPVTPSPAAAVTSSSGAVVTSSGAVVASPTVAAVGGPVPLRVRLGAGERLTVRSPGSQACPGLDALIELRPGGTIRLTAYATTCATTGNERIGNGSHGVYRTVADIPADRRAGAVTVPTALGEATAFDQPYYECTNSCRDYVEPVAVITLDRAADPAYPTVTVSSEKGTVGLDRLAAFLRDQLLA